MKRILVLGGNGFVGQHVVSTLKQQGKNILYWACRETGLNLCKPNDVIEVLSSIKPNVIINCAAHLGSVHYVTEYAADIIRDNTDMSLNLYKAIKTLKLQTKIVNPLANCAYPGQLSEQWESDFFNGEVHSSVFAYGSFKRYLYTISKCYENQYGIKSVNLLAPNSFGEGDSLDPERTHAINGMIVRMIMAKRNGDDEFEIRGTGNPVREWLYVKDFANLLIKGIDIDTSDIINLAQEYGYTIADSAKIIAEVVGYSGKLAFNTKYADGAPSKILVGVKFRSYFPDYKFYDHKEAIKNTVIHYEERL